MPINTSSSDEGATGAAKFVTSTVGNTVGGLARTVGGVTGALGRGLGDTITGATGSAGKPVGDALGNTLTGVENGTKKVAVSNPISPAWIQDP
ncbi:hypothetical protein H2200_005800 [Cladophialophora chaetospira]|uniref:Uncharacterized protein n=1 Tax=Cladophialophora chaetospira TaxID=386627 RepID=A0AA38X9U5_9EURO|nr:hypothetical protein H2200_005800 [Cladophialophora chaetospira]